MYRNIVRELSLREELAIYFQDALKRVEQLLQQTKHSANKLYSLHAPEVECIAKGKAHKKYEFGIKASIVTTHKSNFVIGMKTFADNPYLDT